MSSTELVQFGDTDLHVSRFCQGTAFRNMPREPSNTAGQRVLEHCIDVGLNFFDSANGYGWGGSELLLGKAISGKRDRVVICTKVGASYATEAENTPNEPAQFTRQFLSERVAGSLDRIGTDYIDLYLLHKPDGMTSTSDVAQSMEALVGDGKIRYWGVSNHEANLLIEYIDLVKVGAAPHFAGVEEYYNIGGEAVFENGKSRTRMIEQEIFPLLRQANLGMLAFSPHDMGNLVPGRDADAGTPTARLLKSIDQVAKELEVPRSQVCVAWSLSHPEVTSPLGAAESPEHVEDNLSGTRLQIPEHLLDLLNTASKTFSEEQENS